MTSEHRRAALWIFVAFAVLYAALTRGHFVTTDEVLVYQATQSIWRDGDLSVEMLDKREAVLGRGGERYAQYNSGQSVAALPFYALGTAVGRFLETAHRPDMIRLLAGKEISRPGARWSGEIEIFFVLLLNVLLGAALCAIFFLFSLRLGASTGSALIATALLGLASYPAGFATGFFQHPSENLFLLLTFFFLFIDTRSPGWRWRLAAGAAAALMLQFRFPSVFALPGMFLYLAVTVWRRAPAPQRVKRVLLEGGPLAAGVAIGFLLHSLDEYAKFGEFLNRGYGDQGFNTPLLKGLNGLLLSPGHSLFLYSPLLILAPWMFWRFIRRWPAESFFILFQFVVFTVVYAKFDSWHGMACFGPRYLVAIVPLLLLPLGRWLDESRSVHLLVAAPFAIAGLVVQTLHVMVNFWSVLTYERLLRFAPDYDFLFDSRYSPIVAHWRALMAGDSRVDFWLMSVAREFGASTAIGIGLGFLLLLGGAVLMIARSLSPELSRAGRAPEPAWAGAAAMFAFAILSLALGAADLRAAPEKNAVVKTAAAADTSAQQQALMEEGLRHLYTLRDAAAAEPIFRKVLTLNPEHYGATYQLAKSLDEQGRTADATPLWHKVLAMAKTYSDSQTLAAAAARIDSAGGP